MRNGQSRSCAHSSRSNDVRQAVHQRRLEQYARSRSATRTPGWFRSTSSIPPSSRFGRRGLRITTPGCLCSANRIRRFRATPSVNPRRLIQVPSFILLNACARVLIVAQSFFLYSMVRTRSATCCAKLVSAFSNHPHPRPPEATPAFGGSGVNPFLSVGSTLPRCAHAAHGVRSCNCALSGRSGDH